MTCSQPCPSDLMVSVTEDRSTSTVPLYNVTRLIKNANSITLHTSSGIISVTKFQEGSSVGVYTQLAVTQAIKFQAIAGGIEVKHIFPWGSQAGNHGNYDIGTSANRFNTAWLNYLDIKGKPPMLTKSLNGYPGMVHADGTDSNWLRTPLNGLIPYASGGSGSLGTSSWPFNNGYFKTINAEAEGTRSAGSRLFGLFKGGSISSTAFTRVGNTYRFKKSGTFTFYFGLRSIDSSGVTAYGRLYKNGVAVGTQRSRKGTSFAYFSENLSLSGGDIFSIYIRSNYNNYAVEVSDIQIRQAEEGTEA